MPCGFDDDLWNAAKEEAKQILAERARLRGIMPYSELAQAVTTITFDQGDHDSTGGFWARSRLRSTELVVE
jgi:hypothetical protein